MTTMREYEDIVRKAIESRASKTPTFDNTTDDDEGIDVKITSASKDTYIVTVDAYLDEIELYGKIWNPDGDDYDYGHTTYYDIHIKHTMEFDKDLDDIEKAIVTTTRTAVDCFMKKVGMR